MAEMGDPIRNSPLEHREPLEGEGGAVRMSEAPLMAKFILRAVPEEAVEKLRGALGLGLPFDPLTSSRSGETAFLWMGPDEWMLVTLADNADATLKAAQGALAGIHHQLVAVGDYYTIIELAGPKARDLLMKLTTLDMHPRAFTPGTVAGALFGRANAMVWQIGDDAEEGGPVFRLFVRWSMADYLWCLMAEAGREWGVPEAMPVTGERMTVV